jgi:hypothetical protein
MVEAAGASETSLKLLKSSRRYNPEGSHLWLLWKLFHPANLEISCGTVRMRNING